MPIPEILSGSNNAGAIYSDSGAVIFRKLLPKDAIDQFSLLCAAVFAIMDLKVKEKEAGEARSDDPLSEYVKLYGQLQFIGEDVVRTLLASASMGHAGFDKLVAALSSAVAPALQHKLQYVPSKSTLRRQGTTGHAQVSAYVPWHRDAHAVRTADLGDCLNCWVPMNPVGRDRPSLQVVLGSSKVLRDVKVDYEQNDNPSDEQVLKRYGADAICTAVLEPGDVLVFSHHTLHRTQPMGATYGTRMSGEIRFVVSA